MPENINRIEAARACAVENYARRNSIEIDPDCPVEPVPSGIWVQAWVYVANKMIDKRVAYDAEEN